MFPFYCFAGFYPSDGGGEEVTIDMQDQYKSIAGSAETLQGASKDLPSNENESEEYSASSEEENTEVKNEDSSEYSKSVSPKMEINDEYVPSE